ncbi:MAG: preprotein translocase subunit YajC [Christensenellales bacterium]|nr:preprotein translocase subunit YajC [Clostridia bacterium]
MLGILVVLIVVFMIFNARSKKKNKAAQDEMFKSYVPGSIVTTIGGIVGTIVSVDDINETFVMETGMGDSKTTMKFLKKAVYKIERPEEHKEVEEIVETNEIK